MLILQLANGSPNVPANLASHSSRCNCERKQDIIHRKGRTLNDEELGAITKNMKLGRWNFYGAYIDRSLYGMCFGLSSKKPSPR